MDRFFLKFKNVALYKARKQFKFNWIWFEYCSNSNTFLQFEVLSRTFKYVVKAFSFSIVARTCWVQTRWGTMMNQYWLYRITVMVNFLGASKRVFFKLSEMKVMVTYVELGRPSSSEFYSKKLLCLPNFQVGSIKHNQSSCHILAYLYNYCSVISESTISRTAHIL